MSRKILIGGAVLASLAAASLVLAQDAKTDKKAAGAEAATLHELLNGLVGKKCELSQGQDSVTVVLDEEHGDMKIERLAKDYVYLSGEDGETWVPLASIKRILKYR